MQIGENMCKTVHIGAHLSANLCKLVQMDEYLYNSVQIGAINAYLYKSVHMGAHMDHFYEEGYLVKICPFFLKL